MNILIAPDSLKGSLNAVDFCELSAESIKRVIPDARLYLIPMADGGEGTIEAILANSPGKSQKASVMDPVGRMIEAHYAILEDGETAIIEMAQASGLPLLEQNQRDPLYTTSFGTGELITHALNKGCRRFIIGLGGSATNDGGVGMLQALGAIFLDKNGLTIKPGGKYLHDIETIELSNFDSRINQSEIIIAGDVTNPLLGTKGATHTFGPQKGATKDSLKVLETALTHYALKTEAYLNRQDKPMALLDMQDKSLAALAGTGAAGGMGFALLAYCQASMKSGFELIAEMAQLDKLITQGKIDLILTGEGQFDNQSLDGKLVGRLSERAKEHNIPIIVLCGSIGEDIDYQTISEQMVLFSLSRGPSSLEYAMNNSAYLLEDAILNIFKLLQYKPA